MARYDFADADPKDTDCSKVEELQLQLKDRGGGGDAGSPDPQGNELCPEIVDKTKPASLMMQFLLLLYRNLLMLRRNYVSLCKFHILSVKAPRRRGIVPPVVNANLFTDGAIKAESQVK